MIFRKILAHDQFVPIFSGFSFQEKSFNINATCYGSIKNPC